MASAALSRLAPSSGTVSTYFRKSAAQVAAAGAMAGSIGLGREAPFVGGVL
eukprot:CAMPEP_0176098772 /NCGR_PEP_ID=MMETSP0120_2-20121206/49527_1 /TAXON_ID=160619 /ORGANISM="Kryptoperidinium foliaceum, Strain CCMP 1326" /LENGTH=50 /DNA_ID=CAMNT_0017432787 /DNA_START=203 /DNA_END=352 /DNA_ORIENTATION=-